MKEYKNTSPVFTDAIQIVETTDPAHADNINVAPMQLFQNTLSNREFLSLLLQQTNGLYKGRDLTEVFADEIENYTDAWAWIKARITAGNFTGIHNGDYIPLTVGRETHKMQVNINTYKNTCEPPVGNHIDFISKDCLGQTVKWNTTNNNNGNASSPCPYLVSNVHSFLETKFNALPQAVKNVISNKRFLLERRYSESGALTDSTGAEWVDLGKLWLPTEYEVFGSIVLGTKGCSGYHAVQYPIFANSWQNRIKGAGSGETRCFWWLASVSSGSSTHACAVHQHGYVYGGNASNSIRVPVCFRIAA